jgi:hypothetical protein
MTETMETIDGVRHCACGCGTVIHKENRSGYSRGHKSKHRFEQLNKELNETRESPEAKEQKNLLDSIGDVPSFPGDKLSKEVKADIQDKLDFVLSLMGVAWEAKDPYCGGEFSSRATRIAEKLVPLIARNETLLSFFSTGTKYSATFELAIVLWPVAKMTVQHHITHTVGDVLLEEVDPLAQYPAFEQ